MILSNIGSNLLAAHEHPTPCSFCEDDAILSHELAGIQARPNFLRIVGGKQEPPSRAGWRADESFRESSRQPNTVVDG